MKEHITPTNQEVYEPTTKGNKDHQCYYQLINCLMLAHRLLTNDYDEELRNSLSATFIDYISVNE